MEIHQIRYFLALSETLNFTKAADRCNVAQPSLTRAIKKLEGELGGDLIVRERSQTHLTELGRIMRPMLQKILDGTQSARSAADEFHDNKRASIRVALSHTVEASLVLGPLSELARIIPELDITFFRGNGATVAELLEEGSVDIVIAGTLSIEWDRIERWSLFAEGFSLLVPANDTLTTNEDITIDHLRQLDLMPRHFCEHSAEVLRALQPNNPNSNMSHETHTEADLSAFVEAGLGKAIAPNSIHVPTTVARIPISNVSGASITRV